MQAHEIVSWFGLFALLSSVVISALSYRHRGKEYREGKSKRIPSARSFAFVYRYLQLSTLVVGGVSFLSHSPWLLEIHQNAGLTASGTLLIALAVTLFVASKRELGKEYSPCFDSFVSRRIIRTGPYGLVRHPIYTANILLLFGVFLATGSAWLAPNIVILWTYYSYSAQKEEDALARAFPQYFDYCDVTGRFFPRDIVRRCLGKRDTYRGTRPFWEAIGSTE